jgi:hypothetical protein
MVNICNNFSLSLAGVYWMIADADIFWGNGIDPLSKWVDHIFFRIPPITPAVPMESGDPPARGTICFKGKNLPDSHLEKFDKGCSKPTGSSGAFPSHRRAYTHETRPEYTDPPADTPSRGQCPPLSSFLTN